MDIDHRIGFDERDEAVRRLQDHMAAGRLELDELEERVDAALRARTVGDLIDLFHDLPDEDWMIQAAPTPAPAPIATGPVAPSAMVVTREVTTGSSMILGWAVALVLGLVGLGWALGMPALIVGTALVACVAGPFVKGLAEGLAPTRTIRYVEGDLTSEVKALMGAGLKIHAIKRWREAHPWLELAEAKAHVEMIERGQEPPRPGLER